MKLFVHPMSQNARKALMTAHALGLKPEIEIVDFSKGEHRSEGYLKLNPNGMAPTLVDGERVLWESNAICQYLCDLNPGNSLLPTDPAGRADVVRWQFWEAAHWFPALFFFFRENMIKKMMGLGEPDPAALAEGSERLARFAGVLDTHLAGRKFLVSDAMTLADIAVGSHLMHAERAAVPLQSFGNINSWFARIRETPSWAATEQLAA
jgi:glutathione S-transferase